MCMFPMMRIIQYLLAASILSLWLDFGHCDLSWALVMYFSYLCHSLLCRLTYCWVLGCLINVCSLLCSLLCSSDCASASTCFSKMFSRCADLLSNLPTDLVLIELIRMVSFISCSGKSGRLTAQAVRWLIGVIDPHRLLAPKFYIANAACGVTSGDFYKKNTISDQSHSPNSILGIYTCYATLLCC